MPTNEVIDLSQRCKRVSGFVVRLTPNHLSSWRTITAAAINSQPTSNKAATIPLVLMAGSFPLRSAVEPFPLNATLLSMCGRLRCFARMRFQGFDKLRDQID